MKIDFTFIRWLIGQTDSVIENVAPLIAKVINIDAAKVVGFLKFLKAASAQVVDLVETFINYKAIFGAPGEGLTDASGCNHPDCPCPREFSPVVFALKAQAL